MARWLGGWVGSGWSRNRTGVIGTKGWVGKWVVGGVGWWVDGWLEYMD